MTSISPPMTTQMRERVSAGAGAATDMPRFYPRRPPRAITRGGDPDAVPCRYRVVPLRYAPPVTDLSLVASHPEVGTGLAARGSQRARLVEGMIQAVAEKGYANATVADVTRAARVSRGTFYAQFASKEDCFLEAYNYGIAVMVDRIRTAIRATGPDATWRDRLRTGIHAYLSTLSGEPRFARTHLFEVHLAGPKAGAARDEALRAFADRYRSSFRAALEERPALLMPSDDALF